MEDTLGVRKVELMATVTYVLILVLMEDTLGVDEMKEYRIK